MKSLRRMRGRAAGALAVTLLMTCLYIPAANAADAIQTDALCSLTLTVPDGSVYSDDADAPEITVKLYRIASVSESRHFTMLDNNLGIDIETLAGIDGVDWAEQARTAAAAISRDPDREATLSAGTGTARNLETGMYLITMDSVKSPEYVYTFTPYFISLPNNLYYSTGKASDDAWIYDAESFIKIGQELRYGSIVIEKDLRSFNESLEQVTVAFTAEGKKGEVVNYSNAAMITFYAAGKQTTILTGIPARTTVTIKEVYEGASYKLSSAPTQTAVVIADDAEGAPVKVSFANTYDDENKKGYGIENHFSYDNGEWNLEKRGDVSEDRTK